MNPYIDKLKKCLSEHPPKYGDDGIHTLLEHLWNSYTELNPVDNSKIQAHILVLDTVFDSLSFDKSNLLFGTVCSLYQEIERQAFLDGVHVGARLAVELAE